jgi:shikimate kinase
MWTSFVGFMGSGKSTVTRTLCRMTGRPLAVSDELVVAADGRSIPEIFAAEGEAAFRARERDVLTALDAGRSLVVDTGGGVVETPDLVALLRERGVVIWLDAPWTLLRERLRAETEGGQRPLVAELGWAGLERLHRRRRRLYAAAADFRLGTVEGRAAELARIAGLRSLLWQRRHEARER